MTEIVQRGLGYVLTDSDRNISASVARLRESRSELSGELSVCVAGEHVTISRLNLTSAVARRTMAQLIRNRVNGHAPDVDWQDVLEQLSVAVLAGEHAPAPLVELGHRPRRPAPPRIIDPIIPAGAPTLLFGPGGAGKSTIAAALAVSLASGHEVVRGWLPRQSRVAYVDYEASEDELNDRVAAIAAGAGIPVPAGVFYQSARRALADQVEELAERFDEQSVDVVIVDSVALASGTAREGGDAAETALRLFSALRVLRRTAILIDHVKGEDVAGEHASARPYGSVYKINLSRAVYELRREPDTAGELGLLGLLNRKLNDGPTLPPIGLRTRHDPGQIVIERCEINSPDLEQRALTVADRMRRELRTGALTVRELADRLNVPAESIRTALHRGRSFQRLADQRVGLVL